MQFDVTIVCTELVGVTTDCVQKIVLFMFILLYSIFTLLNSMLIQVGMVFVTLQVS